MINKANIMWVENRKNFLENKTNDPEYLFHPGSQDFVTNLTTYHVKSKKFNDIIKTVLFSDKFDSVQDHILNGPLKYLQYMVISGSYSYNTDTEDSDIDIRGWYFPNKNDILKIGGSFEYSQTFSESDATFYSFHKFIKSCMQCNPNIIELLGVPEEAVIYQSEIAKLVRSYTDLFLSKRVFKTFGGYATSCLKALEDSLTKEGDIDIDKVNSRNKRKSLSLFYKHAMHLIRLYYIGIDILKEYRIQTYREKEHDILMRIRNGVFSFSEILKKQESLQKEFQKAYDESKLPDEPNKQLIDNVVIDIIDDYLVGPQSYHTNWLKFKKEKEVKIMNHTNELLIDFTAIDARSLQLETNAEKRTTIVNDFKNKIWNDVNKDEFLLNLQYDILLTAQTQSTKTICFAKFSSYYSKQLERDVTYKEIKSLLEKAGYTVRVSRGFILVSF